MTLNISPTALSRRRVLAVGLGSIGAITLAACGSGGTDSSSASTKGAGSTSLGTVSAAGSSTGSFGVMRQGLILAMAELKDGTVHVTDVEQPTALLSMQNGSVTTASMSWLDLCQARITGYTALGAAPIWASHSSILVPPGSSITTPEDLAGKTIGAPAVTTGAFTEPRDYLMAQGFDMMKKAKVTNISDATVLLAAFEKGEFDALISYEPIVSQLLAAGKAKEILQVGTAEAKENGGKLVPVNSWGIRSDWVKGKDPAAVKRLFARANEIVKTSDQPWTLAAKKIGLDDAATALFKQRFSKLVSDAYTDDGLKVAQTTIDNAVKAGNLKQSFSTGDLVLGT